MKRRSLGALVSIFVLGGILAPGAQAGAAQTFSIIAGQDFFGAGVPGFSVRMYPGHVKVHQGDVIKFDFPVGLAPLGLTPQEYIGEHDTKVGGAGNLFEWDEDEGERALKLDLAKFFDPGVDCGSESDPCEWGSNSEPIFPMFPEEPPFDTYVKVTAPPGSTLYAAGAASPDVNSNLRVDVVPGSEPTSSQSDLDDRARRLMRKDHEDALALHARYSAAQTWHRDENGKKVYDVFVGAAGGPIEMFASYPKKITVPQGSRVQFHFMSQVDVHTATFGGRKAKNVMNNFFMPACDPDGDGGSAADLPAEFDPNTGEPTCPPGTELEGDVHPKFAWEVGDGKVSGHSDYENSGLNWMKWPEGSDFDVNPNPWTETFVARSGKKGFKYICLIHGGFMGGRVRVK